MFAIRGPRLVCLPFLAGFPLLMGGCPVDPGVIGPIGPAGADGSLRIYGDGSAGALTAPAGLSAFFTTIATNGNLQFTDVTIPSGSTVFVPSGTIIRCTGTFTNNGAVSVIAVASTAGQGHFGDGSDGSNNAPSGGVSSSAASSGEIGDETLLRAGGRAGTGLAITEARNVLNPGVIGGGGGAGSNSGAGGAGGGTVTILARTAIVNATGATISALGAAGTAGKGGGAGGVVILASPGTVTNSGSITVKGGAGGASDTSRGPGGGGGGGIIHLLTPTTTLGTVDITGGGAGALGGAGSILTVLRVGGGGGGACGGGGGQGGPVDTGVPGTPFSASAGFAGHSLSTTADPTSLF
ncbi:MAG: hypothetical protein AABZ08_05625 [Planctomycetota bacterium]